MNEIINRFLSAGDKFMPKMNLRQHWFTYRACWRSRRFTIYLSKRTRQKSCFQHGMAYGDFKDLTRRITADKI